MDVCPKCEDRNFVILVDERGERTAVECDCVRMKRVERSLAALDLDDRGRNMTFEGFRPKRSRSQEMAYLVARRYVEEYPMLDGEEGLLFYGGVGTGKTHLAISLLRELVATKGARGHFVNVRDALTGLKKGMDAGPGEKDYDAILGNLLDVQVLVLDDLGAERLTDWSGAVIREILDKRHRRRLPTIITTNCRVSEGELIEPEGLNFEHMKVVSGATRMEKEMPLLAIYTGLRIESRLEEMVKFVEVQGPDGRRRSVKAAHAWRG